MSMAVIGDKLKQAREKRALTVEQVQKQTLIHAPVLIALEEGRCDDMLTPTYVKSFLKKYANFLGIDSKELVSEYASLHVSMSAHNINPDRSAKPKKNETKSSAILFRRIVIAFTALIIMAIFAFIAIASVRFVYSRHKKTNRLDKAVMKTRKPAAKSEKAAAQKNAEKSPDSTKSVIPKNVPLNVVLKVRSPVWIEMKKDGEKLFQRVIPKGWAEPMTAREKIELFVANGDVVEIFLNGKSLGSPGKGVIKNLEITRSGMRVK